MLTLLQAFVLTKGTKHYRTDDRGATWTPFHVPAQPAFVSNPLSFHSDKDKWGHILYLGTKCEKNPMGWGQICEDVVSTAAVPPVGTAHWRADVLHN